MHTSQSPQSRRDGAALVLRHGWALWRVLAGSTALWVAACTTQGIDGSDASTTLTDAAETPVAFTVTERTLMASLSPTPWPAAPPDPSNRWADDGAAAMFGRRLFEDAGLSGELLDVDNDGGGNALGRRGETGRVACAGCHMESAGFSDTRSAFQQISLGAGWTTRRTPSLLDVAQAPVYGWGGRHSTLHSQIFAPLENPLEMNSSRLFLVRYVRDHYRSDFESVFGVDSLAFVDLLPALDAARNGCHLTVANAHPRQLPPDPGYECHGMPGDGAEYDSLDASRQDAVTRIAIDVGKAIAAYERTLGCGPGRFDAFVHGDDMALSPSEQRGLSIFLGRGRCIDCHSGAFFSDQRFHAIGVAERPTEEGILNANDHGAAHDLALAASDPLGIASPYSDGDDGRVPTVQPEHDGAFRTPTLRCVADRPSYMHSGLIETLDGVVGFFDRGGDPSGYIGTNVLRPLGLSPQDRRDLLAFLEALGPSAPAP